MIATSAVIQISKNELTDAQKRIAETKRVIAERFEVLELLTNACMEGTTRSLIVSGPPGLGKSYTIFNKLAAWDSTETQYSITKGYMRATGLYKLLYKHRFQKHVLVLDDTDMIFFDDISLSLLKAVCDTTKDRIVSWKTEAIMFTEDNTEQLPKSFLFEGACIFLTNNDFDHLIAKGDKRKPHLEAMMSRSHYIDLAMKTRQDFLIRIYQVVREGLLSPLSIQAQTEIMTYLAINMMTMREMSLRMAIKLKDLYMTRPNDWKRIADVTCRKK